MPQLRSATFAPGPDLSEAYTRGVGLNQNQQEIDQRGKIARDQIANQYAIAEMEAATKRSALAQQALMQAQELEVEKSYKQQQIGLKEREQQAEQQKIDFMLEQGAQQYRSRQAMRAIVDEQLRAGKAPGEALARAAALEGTGAGAAGQLMGDVIQTGPGGAKAPLGRPVAMPLLDEQGKETGRRMAQTSTGQYTLLPEEKAAPTAVPTPGMQGRMLTVGNRQIPAPAFQDFQKLEKATTTLAKELKGDDYEQERRAFNRAKDPKEKLTERQKGLAQTYAEKLAALADMEGQIVLGKQRFGEHGGSTNGAPKRRIWNPETGKLSK